MKAFLVKLFSGKDNETMDIARILLAIGVLVFVGCAIWHVVENKTFDPSSYGLGFGSLLAGGGIGIGAKAHTEPGN